MPHRPPADIEVDSPDAELRTDLPRQQTGTAAGRRELAGTLAGLSLRRQVFALAMWPFFEQMLNFMVGFVDITLAANLPDPVAATSAIAVAGYIAWLMSLMHMAVGVGGTAIIARAIGARHRRLANTALGQAIVLGFGWGVVTGLAIFLAAPWIGLAMGLESNALAMCTSYLRITSLAMPVAAVLFVGNASLRGAGDTFTPFICMIVVNVVNVILSVLLVWGPAPIGGHGMAGLATGTAIAWAVGSAVTLYRLGKGGSGIRLRWIRLRPRWGMLKRIARIGAPFLVESSGQWGGNFLVLKIVSLAGVTGAMGAHMIAIRLEALSFLPGAAIGTAAATLTGQYLGMNDPQRARQAVMICWRWAAGIMLGVGLMLTFFPEQLVRLVTSSPELLEATPPLLRLCGPVQCFFGTYMVLSQAMRGAGATRSTAILGNFSTFIVRLPLAYLVGHVMGLGLWGVWIALCSELVFRGSAFAILFLTGRWTHAKV